MHAAAASTPAEQATSPQLSTQLSWRIPRLPRTLKLTPSQRSELMQELVRADSNWKQWRFSSHQEAAAQQFAQQHQLPLPFVAVKDARWRTRYNSGRVSSRSRRLLVLQCMGGIQKDPMQANVVLNRFVGCLAYAKLSLCSKSDMVLDAEGVFVHAPCCHVAQGKGALPAGNSEDAMPDAYLAEGNSSSLCGVAAADHHNSGGQSHVPAGQPVGPDRYPSPQHHGIDPAAPGPADASGRDAAWESLRALDHLLEQAQVLAQVTLAPALADLHVAEAPVLRLLDLLARSKQQAGAVEALMMIDPTCMPEPQAAGSRKRARSSDVG